MFMFLCFQEETIGVDCITHGRYGYVDPTGEHRNTNSLLMDFATGCQKAKIPNSVLIGNTVLFWD